MLRWDGTSWKRSTPPKQFDKAWSLEVGGSPSGETIWAAASVAHGDEDASTEHLWRFSDGRWTHQFSRDATWTGVIDIAVSSRDDAWFVTSMDPDGAPSAVLRWDGRALRYQEGPGEFDMTAVAAAGPNDVWVVSRRQGPRTLHWNGAAWKEVDHPCVAESVRSPCRGRRHLAWMSLTAQPDGRAWAVGPASADGGSPIVLHWDRTRWTQVSLNVVQTGLTAVRTDPVSGLWIAASPASGAPYVLNLRDGRWTRSTLPGGGPADRIIDIAPAPGTTRLWVHTVRRELAGDKEVRTVYELVQ
ncbi:hypothetical protein SAMN05421869_107325 [Nonomuraea jiangxiensis]|uniref:Uncharacterized protein n=2 Tax=Nonomuraea jiangxiensis TaxID=633440 RepID=A0A1G8P6H3_9ACTN|nr:hypothetical protein SAMN05421869_107325 [Nonomuraea jiangxiensis]